MPENDNQDDMKDYEAERRESRQSRIPSAPKPERPRFGFLISLLIAAAVGFFYLRQVSTPVRPVAYTDFMDAVKRDQLTTVTIYDNDTVEWSRPGNNGAVDHYKAVIPYHDPDLLPALRDKGIRVTGSAGRVTFGRIVTIFGPWLMGFLLIFLMLRTMQGGIGGRSFQFGKSRAKRYVEHGKKVTFADVAGQEDAKGELQEVVAFLKAPEKFTRMGAKIPKGILLVGMPGTGKTLMARAVAGEADVAYFHMSGSDFVEMFVGVGASRVRDLFEQGRRASPCIIFIDELDAVGRTRGAGYGGGHDEREQTLNQMLVEMDGFDSKEGVIILAATNRPDVLDPALLRPGRFDRQVVVAMPDLCEREAILKIHSGKVALAETVDLSRIARATPGMSGADISNLVNEAALLAARKDKDAVDMSDFEEARDKILMGVARKSLAISEKERRMTAFHEAGHALLHYFLENADPLHKVTIIPHGKALGMAMSLPEQDKYAHTRAWLLDRIVICYGGWAAENLIFNETTTGTQADLEQATGMARQMVCEWGMSEDLGPVTYGQKDEPIFLGKEIARHKDYSEETARHIDAAIRGILDQCRSTAEKLLSKNRARLESLAAALLEKETLIDNEIRVLLRLPPRVNPASLVD
ncbi:MAG: ATP-dependent zinc metalloprotease FtsH [Spirochaetaceae bacterium]|jgi:cell division protease FtsH|nr:ATP-dependent zinc metalloprotease FtsH [Spirochaetaceae bacterium]